MHRSFIRVLAPALGALLFVAPSPGAAQDKPPVGTVADSTSRHIAAHPKARKSAVAARTTGGKSLSAKPPTVLPPSGEAKANGTASAPRSAATDVAPAPAREGALAGAKSAKRKPKG